MDPMILSVLYVWCQLNKDTIVNFWFGTQFKAMYLPWVLLAFNLILSNGGMFSVVGIVVGHLYFFMKFKYPQELGGPSYLETPAFLYVINWIVSNRRAIIRSFFFIFSKHYFPDAVGGVHGFGVPPVYRPNAPEANAPNAGLRNRIFGAANGWGRGQVLGNN